VITNWHVVRDAAGHIQVLFPDGFRSVGRVLKVDRDWDLAAVLIWRPNVDAVPLASNAPRPGETLSIAGYGSGDYRLASGRCIQYVSPGRNLPFEIIELSRAARQGDSGGPIFNQRGELAGVLFGAGQGTTAGSYCGRVRGFLSSVIPSQPREESNWIVAAPAEDEPLRQAAPGLAEPREPVYAARIAIAAAPEQGVHARESHAPPVVDSAARRAPSSRTAAYESPRLRNERPVRERPFTAAIQPPPETNRNMPVSLSASIPWEAYAGRTATEKLKTALAAIGALTLICGGWRSFKSA
jgi:hypothetical protein